MPKPIFYDPTGRRRKVSFIGVVSLIVVAVLLFIGLIVSILLVPVQKDLDLHMEYPKPSAWTVPFHKTKPRQIAVHRGKPDTHQTVAAFYIGDDPGRASLERHVNDLDIVIPSLAIISGANNAFIYTPDYQFRSIIAAAKHQPAVMVMVQNTYKGSFDGVSLTHLLANPAQRKTLIGQVEDMLRKEKAAGVVFDFEALPAHALGNYVTFIREARAQLSRDGFQVTLTAPIDDDTWNLKAFAKASDKLFLMLYDQHSMVDPAGPIATQDWFNTRLTEALKSVPLDKAIACIGNYAYDWHDDQADVLTIPEAWLIAHDSDAPVQFDETSGNPNFSYQEGGKDHQVWMLDAVSAWNQLLTVNNSNPYGVALWRLGSEDPGVWSALQTFQTDKTPDLRVLQPLGNVDVEGNGEVLHIDSTPTYGARTVTFDKNRVAQTAQYQTLPTPYVVRRTGLKQGHLALTFDDGPDAKWTPQVLKILREEKVPATFFVIGEKAISHPALLRQMVHDGDQIGNHSYTHPDMSKVSPEWARVELNSTQRVVEAYTGRSMRLLRAPYFGDAEPTTENELGPALLAQQLGYTNVGLHVDSEDWTRPGVDAIIKNTLDGVRAGKASQTSEACLKDPSECHSGQIILMHDSGGVRSETIAALPTIIRTLKAEGYTFTTVGDLVGLTPDQVMPKLSGADLAEVRFDVGIFMFLAWTAEAFKWIFIIAIILGITRALVLSGLAIYAEFSHHMVAPGSLENDAQHDEVGAYVNGRFVSVLIPAFNEARVIENSVRRVLSSIGVNMEVIVIDDGSKDATSAIVAEAFKDEPRVRLITQANAGKATAVNNGIAASKGDIIIALDADTQFEPETIARLVRWFIRPEIGAVAGNAKVGNRFNWVTRWQAVEYVTSQNLERSALAMFDAMMVVPGAVGAWRRAALAEVGNYPHNTLAEDQDLTIAIQHKGWKVAYDQEAVAWTESPESFGALMKQRFRWAFGTLQCLWKHRTILKEGKPKGLAFIGIPQAWMFQIGFSVISPLIDFALVVNIINTALQVSQHGWAATSGDLERMLFYWIAFLTIDAICGGIAYWLEPREKSYPVFWLLSQRFVYRQIMYYVVIKALFAAGRGMAVGWGKLERSGRTSPQAKG